MRLSSSDPPATRPSSSAPPRSPTCPQLSLSAAAPHSSRRNPPAILSTEPRVEQQLRPRPGGKPGQAAAAANNEILFRRLQRDSSSALAVAAVRDHNGKHGNLYN